MPTTFRPYNPMQGRLLPADLGKWLPEGRLARHVDDIVDSLDFGAFYAPNLGGGRRNSPFDPRMIVKVLVYTYASGMFLSRRIAKRLEKDVAFRMLATDNFPSHRTICEFRRLHLEDFEHLFVQVVRLEGGAGATVAKRGRRRVGNTQAASSSVDRQNPPGDPANEVGKPNRGSRCLPAAQVPRA